MADVDERKADRNSGRKLEADKKLETDFFRDAATAHGKLCAEEFRKLVSKHFRKQGTPVNKTTDFIKRLAMSMDDEAIVRKLRTPTKFDANLSHKRNKSRAGDVRVLMEKFGALVGGRPAKRAGDANGADRTNGIDANGIDANDKTHGSTLLDIGCNNGEITLLTAEGFDRVVGTEVTDTRTDAVKNAPNFDFHLVTGSGLPLPDSSVDVVTAIQVLHHVHDQGKMASEVVRVLRPGGMLVVREQDLAVPGLKAAFDLEHMIYDCIKNTMPYEEFVEGYYSDYHPEAAWNEMFSGLTRLVTVRDEDSRFGRCYYAVYKKPE